MKSRLMLPLRFKGRPISVEVTNEGLEFRRHGTRDTAFVHWDKVASLAFGGQVFHARELDEQEQRAAMRGMS